MSNVNVIRLSILKTVVRGSNESPSYNILMEEDDLTIIFYPLANNDDDFEHRYETVSDVISQLEVLTETAGYFDESDAFSNHNKHLVGLLNGSLSVEDLPEHIELVGFEGLK